MQFFAGCPRGFSPERLDESLAALLLRNLGGWTKVWLLYVFAARERRRPGVRFDATKRKTAAMRNITAI